MLHQRSRLPAPGMSLRRLSTFGVALAGSTSVVAEAAIVDFKTNGTPLSLGTAFQGFDVFGTGANDLRLRAAVFGAFAAPAASVPNSAYWKPVTSFGLWTGAAAGNPVVGTAASTSANGLLLAAGNAAFVGFRVAAGTTASAGWIKFSRTTAGQMNLVSGALNTTGGPINYGQTALSAIPEPTTGGLMGLGVLALGARGVRQMRRRRCSASD